MNKNKEKLLFTIFIIISFPIYLVSISYFLEILITSFIPNTFNLILNFNSIISFYNIYLFLYSILLILLSIIGIIKWVKLKFKMFCILNILRNFIYVLIAFYTTYLNKTGQLLWRQVIIFLHYNT
jgi:hypothetical protein